MLFTNENNLLLSLYITLTCVPKFGNIFVHLCVSPTGNRCSWRSKGKGKGKVASVLFCLTEHHTMKAYWGSGSIAPLIL